MDYSILLGIHKIDPNITTAEEIDEWTKRHGVYLSYDKTELYFIGIIDVLTIYNIKKKLERFFKVYIMLQDSVRTSVLANFQCLTNTICNRKESVSHPHNNTQNDF